MLRLNGDTQYKTFTGGVLSILMVAVVIIGFLSMISETLNKTLIDYTIVYNKTNNPTFFNLTSDPQENFMFGIQIQPMDMTFTIDLNNGPRYFDVSLLIYDVQYALVMNTSKVSMQQCTNAQWSSMPEVVQKADLFDLKKWLCPKIGQKLPLQGSFSSAQHYQTLMNVAPCKNETDPTRPCAPQSQIDRLFQTHKNFYFIVNYVNTVINPGQTEYISYYLQASDAVVFFKIQASQAFIYVSDYQITTDSSYWPFSKYETQRGLSIMDRTVNRPFTASDNIGYVQMCFAKSFNSLIYTRTVQKISAVLSYIGGLIGALSAVLFFLKIYTKMSLEMKIAFKLFTQEKKIQATSKHIETEPSSTKEKLKNFNFFSYLYFQAYKLLSFLSCNLKWKTAQIYESYQKEVFNQLDITLILKRMIALENCISFMLEDHQIEGLKHGKKMSFERAKELRQLLVQEEIEQEENQQVEPSKQVDNNRIINQNEEVNSKMGNCLMSPVNILKPQKSELSPINGSQNVNFLRKPNQIQLFVYQDDKIEEAKKPKSLLQTIQSAERKETLQKLKILYQKAYIQNSAIDRKIWENLQQELKQKIDCQNEDSSSLRNPGSSLINNKYLRHKIQAVSQFSVQPPK